VLVSHHPEAGARCRGPQRRHRGGVEGARGAARPARGAPLPAPHAHRRGAGGRGDPPGARGGALWAAYKAKQPLVEKRHDLLENVEAATPVYLKSVARIEALLFLHFVALLVHALVEGEIRQAMRARRLRSLPLYPEQRACEAPTARRIFELFEPLQRHLLRKDGRVVQRSTPSSTNVSASSSTF